MDATEIDTWTRLVSPETLELVDQHARSAHGDWRQRLRDPQEMLYVMPFCLGGVIVPELAARAAALAAVELAIVCHIWPHGARALRRVAPGRYPRAG